MQIKLSVLLPVYNEEQDLANCLQMVFASAAPFEIIAVDDCSTDATPQILARQTDPRFHAVRHAQNLGKGGGIQTALARATGDVVIHKSPPKPTHLPPPVSQNSLLTPNACSGILTLVHRHQFNCHLALVYLQRLKIF